LFRVCIIGAAGRKPKSSGAWSFAGSGEGAAMREYKFTALVTLEPGPERPAEKYQSVTHSIMIRSGNLRWPAVRKYFPALIWRADGQPLRPGDTNVLVTIGITDDQAREYFAAGTHVTLWNGHICGSGTIARQVFFTWAV
jgi:hypothetical protein